MPVRRSEGIWKGSLKNGQGKVRIGGSRFEVDYSFPSRFDSGIRTNPEELLGAAHAGCSSMALPIFIGEADSTHNSIHSRASVHLDKTEKGFGISRIELDTTAEVPGRDEQTFLKQAEEAKNNCPVSRAFSGVNISLSAKLARDQSAPGKPEPDFELAPVKKPRSASRSD